MRYGGLLLVLFLIGCGAERQNFLARNYHTFVSYFNGYYHADKRFRTAQAEIELKTPDPSEGYVRVFPLIDPAIAREHYTRLEEATKKCEVIIFRHKNGRYVDDCRTLIGQCWVLRSNLPNAEQNFSYVLSAFPGTPLRPKVYWWEAYTALQDHNPYRAETRLTEILGMSSREVPRRLRAEAEALLAQALIEKGEPALAVRFLERSAPKLGTRLRRARAYYLLGQLYLEQKKSEAAFQAFQKVVRLNPTNQLTFQAQLQKSLLAGARDPRLLRRLERMAQQTRYEDYRDQIYYRLGHIALESQNYEAALAYFKRAGSGGSSPARALAHYEAGNIYFMHYQDLASAQKHYDSAASLIPENHPRAAELKALQSRFQEYGRLRHEVKLYDSLLTLSSLSPEELDRSLEAYIQSEVSRRAAEKARQQPKRKALPLCIRILSCSRPWGVRVGEGSILIIRCWFRRGSRSSNVYGGIARTRITGAAAKKAPSLQAPHQQEKAIRKTPRPIPLRSSGQTTLPPLPPKRWPSLNDVCALKFPKPPSKNAP